MNRLLATAELIAGRPARHRVFEPLLADWQRELQGASGTAARCAAIASGSAAFVRALAVCAVIDGAWVLPLRVSLASLASTIVAIALSVGVLLMAPPPSNLPRDLSEPLVQSWVLVWMGILVPPAFLLATFMLRRDPRATLRHAIIVALLAGVAAAALVIGTTDAALRRRYDTFEVSERMRERALARHHAGEHVFSGDRYRQTMQTTVAERRANFERYRAQMAAHRQEPPPTWGLRLAQARPVMLAVVFAMLGWALAGFGNATVWRGFAWWALVFAATITTTRILWLVVQVPMPRTPQWIMPTLFISVACALAVNAIRSRLSMRSS